MTFDERRRLHKRSVGIMISMPLTLIEVCDRYAESVGLRTNRVVVDLVREGLRVKAKQAAAARART